MLRNWVQLGKGGKKASTRSEGRSIRVGGNAGNQGHGDLVIEQRNEKGEAEGGLRRRLDRRRGHGEKKRGIHRVSRNKPQEGDTSRTSSRRFKEGGEKKLAQPSVLRSYRGQSGGEGEFFLEGAESPLGRFSLRRGEGEELKAPEK